MPVDLEESGASGRPGRSAVPGAVHGPALRPGRPDVRFFEVDLSGSISKNSEHRVDQVAVLGREQAPGTALQGMRPARARITGGHLDGLGPGADRAEDRRRTKRLVRATLIGVHPRGELSSEGGCPRLSGSPGAPRARGRRIRPDRPGQAGDGRARSRYCCRAKARQGRSRRCLIIAPEAPARCRRRIAPRCRREPDQALLGRSGPARGRPTATTGLPVASIS